MVDSYHSRRFPLFHLKIRADLTQFTSKCEKICVNFHGLKQEQRCVLCFETCLVIWKSYLAELLFLSHSSSSFSGSFTAMRRNDIRVLGHIECACLLSSTPEQTSTQMYMQNLHGSCAMRADRQKRHV